MAETLSEKLSKKITAGLNAIRERLSNVLESTTALSGIADAVRPIPQVKPASVNEFVQMARKAVRQAPQPNGKPDVSINNHTHDEDETLNKRRRAEIQRTQVKQSFVEAALGRLNALSVDALKKVIESLSHTTTVDTKAGRQRPAFVDRDGKRTPAYRVGVTSPKIAQTISKTRSSLDNAQLANEVRVRKNIRTQAMSDEALTFRPLLQDIASKNTDGILSRGWKGIASVVSGMPIPQKYEAEHAQMGMTVRGNEMYVGVAVARSSASQKQTMGAMLDYALKNDLSLPKRKDGAAWTSSSPKDVEMLNALCGRSDSPFVAGGKPPFVEGSDILLNNENLMRMSRIDSRLSPASIEATLGDVRKTLEGRFDRDIQKATSQESQQRAREDRAFLDRGDFGSYAQSMAADKAESNRQRQMASIERQSALPYQSVDPIPEAPVMVAETVPLKPFPVENPTYQDIVDLLGTENEQGEKTFAITSKNIAFRMSDPKDPTTLHPVMYVSPSDYSNANYTAPPTREITDLSGLPEIPDGTYMAMTPTGGTPVIMQNGETFMPDYMSPEVENAEAAPEPSFTSHAAKMTMEPTPPKQQS